MAPRLVIVGGFLGAGKTSTILAASQLLKASGRRPAMIPNDQGTRLVDSRLALSSGLPLAPVEGGCFCCLFDDLVHQVEALVRAVDADVVLAEAVGSCTDLAATVVRPLKRLATYDLAPVTIVVDPAVMFRMEDSGDAVPVDVRYLHAKQIEEADIVLVNKADITLPTVLGLAEEAVRRLNGDCRIIQTSAKTGTGLEEWLAALSVPASAGQKSLQLNYDRYANAEAALAWLNAQIEVMPPQEPDLAGLLGDILNRLGSERVVHLKAVAAASGFRSWAAKTWNSEALQVQLEGAARPVTDLRINLRALADPVEARAAVEDAIAARPGLRITSMESFRPAYPKPTHRDAVAA